MTGFAKLVAEECAKLVGENYGWIGKEREYADNLGEAIRAKFGIET